MILVVNCFVFLKLLFCFVVAIFDIVHDVEALQLQKKKYEKMATETTICCTPCIEKKRIPMLWRRQIF